MDFDTSKRGGRDRQGPARGGGSPDFSTGRAGHPARGFDTSHHQDRVVRGGSEDFRIPAGSRKAALVHLALEAWRKGLLDPKGLGEVRGRDVDEAGLQRALYRSSMGEIEHVLGPIVKGRKVVVEGHLSGTGRTALERLGAEVEELRLEDERRYIDMTPVIFVVAAVAMAVRYVSLGLDDQSLYILAGIAFALMYGLRPFFFKMQRPRDE
ncbi:hypothetical protein Rxyl_1913 [Rubrobacter xylanophilus DSM 9941]|uniref:Uncharacterized protein n=1 Tax=Rubrobacter xylanophilus (strain DSM 9941 / JCM 11954 / NBRC 16129 / PRD-1) TaxID=266117 RepID=Q1AUR8_RUBXD|nr:hypothetical protein [Rubrobacter xylanophilus]ABG04860.1 hypothetical protein Rxyl_1913 [Rubrobacter xylanophilus DSM 9941]